MSAVAGRCRLRGNERTPMRPSKTISVAHRLSYQAGVW